MLRVKAQALSVDDQQYYFQGELFSGIAFTLDNGKVINAVQVDKGDIKGEYTNKYLPDSVKLANVDSDCLEPEADEEDEPLCYHGERFSGIAYDFDGIFCTGELYYSRGWLESEVTYYKSGELDAVELIGDDFSESYYWYEDGQIKGYEIFARDSFEICLSFDENGAITVLRIEGDYFEASQDMSPRQKFHLFHEKSFTRELNAAEYLSISGSAVDDEVFGYLLDNGGLDKTSKLSICDTSISETSIRKLIDCRSVKALHIESETISSDVLKELQASRPDCAIELNPD